MRIVIGCDHIVTALKNEIRDTLIERGHDVIDVGTYDFARTHYPIFGQRVGDLVASGKAEMGIAICGTAVGISNAAQKVKGTRVVLASDVITAVKAREEYDANVVAFGGRIIGVGAALDIVDHFMTTKYKGENDEIVEFLNTIGHEGIADFDSEMQKWRDGYYHD